MFALLAQTIRLKEGLKWHFYTDSPRDFRPARRDRTEERESARAASSNYFLCLSLSTGGLPRPYAQVLPPSSLRPTRHNLRPRLIYIYTSRRAGSRKTINIPLRVDDCRGARVYREDSHFDSGFEAAALSEQAGFDDGFVRVNRPRGKK